MSSYIFYDHELTINNDKFYDHYKQNKQTFFKCVNIKLNNFSLSIDFLANIEKIKSIKFSNLSCFNHPITRLPKYLKILFLSLYFNQSVLILPKSLTYLKFGNDYNQKIFKLPPSLTTLEFGDNVVNDCYITRFKQNLHCLPATLENLYYNNCDDFNQNMNNLHCKIKNIYINAKNVDSKLFDNMPNTLEKLTIICDYLNNTNKNNYFNTLPNKLSSLSITCYKNYNICCNNLPNSLISLSIKYYRNIIFNESLNIQNLNIYCISKSHNTYLNFRIPNKIIVLEICFSSCNKLPILNQILKKLVITGNFDYNIDELYYLLSLKILIIGDLFDQTIKLLPESLIVLKIGNNFDRSVNLLPCTLQELKLGDKFNKPINKLPTTLIKFIVGYSFNQNIDQLPPSVQHIQLGGNFTHVLNILPQSLELLILNKNYIHSNELTKNINTNDIFKKLIIKYIKNYN